MDAVMVVKVTVDWAVLVQPLFVTVTVYVPGPVTTFTAVVGPLFHAYVPPPLAVSVALLPVHIVVAPLMDAVMVVKVTVDWAVLVQPLFVTVIVYVPGPVTTFTAVVGPLFHAYVPPPLAVKVALPPVHIVVAPLIEAVMVVKVTVDWAVLVQPLFVTVTV